MAADSIRSKSRPAETVPTSLAAHAQQRRGFLQGLDSKRFLSVPFSSNDVNSTRAKSSAISRLLFFYQSDGTRL
jgi:hypothetical protein